MNLTPPELAIGRLLAEGLTPREIAKQLCKSHRTVKEQLKRLYRKAGIVDGIKHVQLAVQFVHYFRLTDDLRIQ